MIISQFKYRFEFSSPNSPTDNHDVLFRLQVHKISSENGNSGGKVKLDGKQTAEKPRQLFWEKRLSGLRASYPDEEYQPFLLPSHFKPMGPGVKNDVLLASISTNIHMNNGPIQGQSGGKVI